MLSSQLIAHFDFDVSDNFEHRHVKKRIEAQQLQSKGTGLAR